MLMAMSLVRCQKKSALDATISLVRRDAKIKGEVKCYNLNEQNLENNTRGVIVAWLNQETKLASVNTV